MATILFFNSLLLCISTPPATKNRRGIFCVILANVFFAKIIN